MRPRAVWRLKNSVASSAVRVAQFGSVQITAGSLDPASLAQVRALAALCEQHDGGRLKLEWATLSQRAATETSDFQAGQGETLVGFCGIYRFGSEFEVAGMVHPEHRRSGVATALLQRAHDELAARGVDAHLLVCPQGSPGGTGFAAASGGIFASAEYAMVQESPPSELTLPDGMSLRLRRPADEDFLASLLAGAFGEEGGTASVIATPGVEQWLICHDDAPVGTIRLSIEDGVGAVHGFAVLPELQGRGMGAAALNWSCRRLRAQGVATVRLEVAVQNERALGLYLRQGFRHDTGEEYYRLPVRT